MNAAEIRIRERLVARREHLADLVTRRRERGLVDLMRRVDDAIGALEVGTWGLCAVCREPVSRERIGNDQLLAVCLECLAPEDRRALERDLEAAAKAQRAFLPAPWTRHDGWEVAYLWQPRGAVSGDHVDLIKPSARTEPLHLLLGDVAGKGVAASLLQAHLHALFRALAPAGMPLTKLLERANNLFAEATLTASYATLAALRLHDNGRVELANAGHPRPLLADSRGVRPVEGGGLPLGLFAESVYGRRELQLRPGQTLLLYTDGWTEGAKGEEEFGIGRAAAALRRASRLPIRELLASCLQDLETFLEGAPPHDDLTLVAVRRAEAA